MLYKLVENSRYAQTAGKITIAAAASGLLIFAFVFLFNAGKTEMQRVEAQSATTTLTVLNIPPQWEVDAVEQLESSTSSPTNSGSSVSWTATASNNGNQPYFLLLCNTSASATPVAATSTAPGTRPPRCATGTIQWGVSTSTVADTQAIVSTTTLESFSESNDWYAFICDDDAINPRCNNEVQQGTNATNSSPFLVNRRPVFSLFTNNSPRNPSEVITFFSTSTDPDVVTTDDLLTLVLCRTSSFSTTTRDCGANTLATSSVPAVIDVSTSFTLPTIIADGSYDAFGFIIDEHGHTAQGGQQGANLPYVVGNVAPTVAGGTIIVNNGANITLLTQAGQTTGYTLDFVVSDANSCRNITDTANEITNFTASVFRSGLGTTTCTGLPSSYDPNNCYPNSVATSTWNLVCTASSTSCTGPGDPDQLFTCTFPLWYVAEPTDTAGTGWDSDTWTAAIAGIDNNNATGTKTIAASGVPLLSYPAINLLTAEIPFGALEPGNNTGTLRASTTAQAVGNTGINQNLSGEAMCPGFTTLLDCPNSASSTVPEFEQEFGTSTLAYGSGTDLSSTTPALLEIRVPKSTSTSTPNERPTYWGINVPGTITVAGAYTGLNTFAVVASPGANW